MDKVKSLEDLKRIREEAIAKRNAKLITGQKQITVGMGTVGIAAGARETLRVMMEYVEQNNLSDILIRQAGNIGQDSYEPVVKVKIGEEAEITYGKVTADAAITIMKNHIVGGEVVKEFVIQG